ncbi:MAG: ferrous iron transport protein A [Chromatiaceae bacterium]|nr:ferrous iron transport protein A [Chromatiaceae bacterium]
MGEKLSHSYFPDPRVKRSFHPMSLTDLPIGIPARIAEIRGGRQLARRLQGLGLRVGSEIAILHHRGHGVVLSAGGTRVALGGGLVEKLSVEPLAAREAGTR